MTYESLRSPRLHSDRIGHYGCGRALADRRCPEAREATLRDQVVRCPSRLRIDAADLDAEGRPAAVVHGADTCLLRNFVPAERMYSAHQQRAIQGAWTEELRRQYNAFGRVMPWSFATQQISSSVVCSRDNSGTWDGDQLAPFGDYGFINTSDTYL